MMNQGKSILSFLATEENVILQTTGAPLRTPDFFSSRVSGTYGRGCTGGQQKNTMSVFFVALLQCEAPVRYVNVGLDSPQ